MVTNYFRKAAALVAAAAVCGCSSIPIDGPSQHAIESGASTTVQSAPDVKALQYVLIDITNAILPFLTDPGAGSLVSSFGLGHEGPREQKIGTGDVIQVTLFESAAGGLFIPNDAGSRPGNYVTLPQETVDRSGFISVPYAGLIKAGGRTLTQVERDIEGKLVNRAIEPQAVVTLISQISNQAAVVGEVTTPGKIVVSPAGDRVLDIIAKAGGIRWPGYESFVTLERGGRKATIWFDAIIANPHENIYVEPNDTIYIYRRQRSFTAFGATGATGQYKFDDDHLFFSDAVAKAGGLLDARAEPRQVFLYRTEDRQTLARMGADLSQFPVDQASIPTVYRTNFRDPSGFFVAQKFPIRNLDLIYVSNADEVEVTKFLSYVETVTGAAGSVSNDIVSTNAARVVFK